MQLLGFFFPPIFGFGFVLYFLPSIIALARRSETRLQLSS